MARVTTDDLLAAINALAKEQPKRPEGKLGEGGWETLKQMAARQRLGLSAMRFRFARAIDHGLQIERFVGSDYDPTGRLAKQTWFRVKR